MKKIDLSILIPARNEQFLRRTVEDIVQNARGNTEIIVVLDGCFADPQLPQYPQPKEQWPWPDSTVDSVTVIYHPKPVGQRAATNEAAAIARGKWVMKVDAHCAFDEGFDVKMLAAAEGHEDWTLVPGMHNLYAFDWLCPDGHRRFQGPSGPCTHEVDGRKCGKETVKDVLWKPNPERPFSTAYCFDSEPHFQYFHGFKDRPEGRGDVTPTMSLQGSCFMLTKEKYFELRICDEQEFGSWGSQGIEVACKTWLSGGSVMCVQKTWYAHMFRTQGGDFGFPYDNPHSKAVEAKRRAREIFFKGKFHGQRRPLSWLIEKFWPIPGWTDESLAALKDGREVPMPPPKEEKPKKPTKGIVYYSHNKRSPEMMKMVQDQIKKGMKEKHIVSVTNEPVDFGGKRIVQERLDGWIDMFQKILTGLEACEADVVFLCEDDVLYHPSHFDFVPEKKGVFYYNVNMWKLRFDDGFCMKVDDCKQLSGICAYRDTLLEHFRERVRRVKAEGFSTKNGFEPGTRSTRKGGYDDLPAVSRRSAFPIVDIRHGTNSTKNRWKKEEYRNERYTRGWKEGRKEDVPGWELLPSPADTRAKSA